MVVIVGATRRERPPQPHRLLSTWQKRPSFDLAVWYGAHVEEVVRMLSYWHAGYLFNQTFDSTNLRWSLSLILQPELLFLLSDLLCFVIWQGEMFVDIFWAVLWNYTLHLHFAATIHISTQEVLILSNWINCRWELVEERVLVELVVI